MPVPTSEQRPEAPGVGIARFAGLAGAATLASCVLGLARDQVLAALFGAGNETDAFASRSGFRIWCAIRLPKAR